MASKHILITGASSGIGKVCAEILIASGHKVSLIARSEAKLNEMTESLGSSSFSSIADVRDPKAFKQAIRECQERFGPVEVLVNNAGLGYFNKLMDAPLEEWHEMVDTNIKGVLTAIHCVLPGMKELGRGHIINLASVAAHHVFPNSGVYCATKHAVLAISESIRLELSDLIKVTTISPGAVNTPFIDQTNNKELAAQLEGSFRTGLDPKHIAEQIRYAIEYDGEAVFSEIIIRPNKQVNP